MGSVILKLREPRAQERLLGTNHGNINNEQHSGCDQWEPPTSGGNQKANRENYRSQIKRVARMRVRAAGGKHLIFFDVSGGKRANAKSRERNRASNDNRENRRVRQPNISGGEQETQRNPYAAGDFAPARHSCSLTVLAPQYLPLRRKS